MFFLEGVARTADSAVATARRLATLFDEDRKKIQTGGRRAGSALRVYDIFKTRPILNLQEASQKTDLSYPATGTGMDLLVESGIARELTGKRRNRIFAYDRYLAILGEGT